MHNKVSLIGRLTKDIELKELDNDKIVGNLTLAVNRNYKNADGVYETDFFDVSLWNNLAKRTAKYTKKGDLIGVTGSLQKDTYEKENGEKVSRVYVVADKTLFLGSKQKNEKSDDYER